MNAWSIIIDSWDVWWVIMILLLGIIVLTMDRYNVWLILIGIGWFILGALLLGYRGGHL
jgi:hypothetical protein